MIEIITRLVQLYPNKGKISISPEDLALLREELRLDPDEPLDEYLGKDIEVSFDQILIELV